MDTPTDEDLARRAQAGSLEDFEELVRRHEARLYRFLARSCGNDADGADLTQETFVTAHQKLHRYHPDRSFTTWLFTIARRKAIDHLRVRRRAEGEEAGEAIDADSPDEVIAREQDGSELWTRIRRILSDLQYQALWLKYVEDMSVEEIAATLSRTKTHVKVILFRARAALAESLEPAGDRTPLVSTTGQSQKGTT